MTRPLYAGQRQSLFVIYPGHLIIGDWVSLLLLTPIPMPVFISIPSIRAERIEPRSVKIETFFSISSYPNPFNPSTTIAITLPWHMDGTLSIYDVQGQLVRQYHIKNVGRANYRITWPAVNSRGEKVSSGLYLAVLLIDDSHIQSRKVTKLIYLK